MVRNFSLAKTPVVHMGVGNIRQLPSLLKPLGKHVLILTGKRSFLGLPTWSRLQHALDKEHIKVFQASISGEPSPKIVDKIVSQYHEQVDIVVAIGGGSVMDAGKAVSAMLCAEGSVKDYLEGVGTKKPSGKKLPFIAVPTTAGTGSEATKNAVISEVGPQGFKKSLRHDNYVPGIALIDPELMQHAPPSVTAASGMDAFTQLLEAFISTKANSFTDALAQKGLVHIKRGLLQAWKEGDDLEARTDMALAAYYSGIALANAGLGVVHGFASSVGGKIPIPHGVLCGSLMEITNRLSLPYLDLDKDRETYQKYLWVGKLFSNEENKSDGYYIESLIETIEAWSEQFAFPGLDNFGLTHEMIPLIVDQTGQKNHPVQLSKEDLVEILTSRM